MSLCSPQTSPGPLRRILCASSKYEVSLRPKLCPHLSCAPGSEGGTPCRACSLGLREAQQPLPSPQQVARSEGAGGLGDEPAPGQRQGWEVGGGLGTGGSFEAGQSRSREHLSWAGLTCEALGQKATGQLMHRPPSSRTLATPLAVCCGQGPFKNSVFAGSWRSFGVTCSNCRSQHKASA